MPKLLPIALVLLAGCRDERSFLLSDWLEAHVKKPVSGIVSLSPSVTITLRGETILDATDAYFLFFDENIALRDDGHWRVIMVDHAGNRTYLPCPNGASLAPERFPGIDCWAGGMSDDFSIIRYAGNGRVVKTFTVPEVIKSCGRVKVGYIGYDQRGEPVVGYECKADGARMCRATTLEDTPQALGEIAAPTDSVDCAYLMRTQGRPFAGVKSWSKVE